MNAKRHTLLGGIVGACVAVAFSAVLTLQFDAGFEPSFLVITTPACAALGAAFGWIWWRLSERRR